MREQTSHFTGSSFQRIPWNEAAYHPHSFADPYGRVFLWEDQLYRGIYPTAEPFFRALAENGIISNLVEQRLLVNTELTPFASNEFPLVFRHELVPFASYPQEWCPLMFQDAALAIVDLAIELAHAGLVLKDGHPWNVIFDACKPVYIDLGSITPEDGASIWPAYPDFCRYCLYPLILMSQGYDLIGRLLMCEDRGVRESELFRLAPRLAFRAYSRWPVNRVLSYAEKYLTSAKNRLLKKESTAVSSGSRKQTRNQKKLLSFLKRLRQLVESIPVSTFDFQKGVEQRPVASTQESHDGRAVNGEVIHRLLTELHPDSILDINSGTGLLAKQAANLGTRVVCFETDLRKVSHLYKEAKMKGLSILPLVMDFTKPTPARGLGSHWAIAATERFQCDLVLALDVMNQPTPRRLGFDKIISGFSQFTKRWLVLEIPLDPGSNSIQSDGFSIDSCTRLLERQFRTITKIHSYAKGSMLLVCEKH
jgi:hypothetical protein